MVMQNQFFTRNTLLLGVVIGLGLPIISFFLYFLFRIHSTSFSDYFKFLLASGKIVHVMSISVVPNLAPFFFFINSNRFQTARGILGSTIGIAILIFTIKLI
jgi:hypothetical protein